MWSHLKIRVPCVSQSGDYGEEVGRDTIAAVCGNHSPPASASPHKNSLSGDIHHFICRNLFGGEWGGRGGGGESAGRQTSPCLRDERRRRITMHDILTKPFVVHAGRRRPLLYNKGGGGEAEGLIKW